MPKHLRDIHAYLTPLVIRQLSLSALALWIPVIIFAALADEVTEPQPLPFDVPILHFIHSLASPGLNKLVVVLTNLGSPVAVSIGTLLFALACYHYRNHRAAYFVVISAGGAALINLLLKATFQRARPELWQSIITEKSFSFPSGHAMGSSALALSAMVVFWNTRWRWAVVMTGTAYAVIIGLSRLYLGVHYPSDILAGWCVSLIWIGLVRKIFWQRPTVRA